MTTTATATATAPAGTPNPASDKVPLPLRPDTMLGVCEGLGEEFGFHPNWLRIALVLPIFFQPVLTTAVYLGMGMVLAFARWIAPDKVAEAPQPVAAPTAEARVEEEEFRIAA